ncbi:MAG TPA: UDP-N-acetylmuramoyl-tripeptide--D-alanyl-D-alanine ligase, partial [Chromatiaceae bacterium]|nr:UDP-N-acetylmuramoyl-tripeptide--D-alanyl-D-alanine ligase [Chromatiaceae bacterium]
GSLAAEAATGFGAQATVCQEQMALIASLESEASNADLLLIKGSRLSAMERIVAALCDDLPEETH